MSKYLRNEVIENLNEQKIAEINFYFAIPWDIRRRNVSAAFVRLAEKGIKNIKISCSTAVFISRFSILYLALSLLFFGLL